MQNEPDVVEAEITLEDTEESQETETQETETQDIGNQDIDETDSSPEKVVFSEAQQAVLDREIGKKVRLQRDAERRSLHLENEVNKLQAQINKPVPVEVPPMPDAFSMTDADYRRAVEDRDRAIVAKVNADSVAQAQQEHQRLRKAEEIKRQQEATSELTESYVKRATELGIPKKELQTAGANLIDAGIDPEISGYIVRHERGPLIAQYLGQNPLELDKLIQAQYESISGAAVHLHEKIGPIVDSLAKSNVNRAPDPINKPATSGKQRKQGGPKGATFE